MFVENAATTTTTEATEQARKEGSANVLRNVLSSYWGLVLFIFSFLLWVVLLKLASTMKSTIPITLALVLYSGVRTTVLRDIRQVLVTS